MSAMKIAILHYHLNRGGVTRVIQNHLLALDAVLDAGETLRVALIHGGRQVGWPGDFPDRLRSIRLTLHAVARLDYDDQQAADALTSGSLHEELAKLLDDLGFAPRETVVHVHNHAVGKNVSLPESAARLAQTGYGLLLHVHDFVEDYRPRNFRRFQRALCEGGPTASWHGQLYPQAPHVHYAVLTSRDHEVLKVAGTDPARLPLLPNPVPERGDLPSPEEARGRLEAQFAVRREDRFVLYPVRCIRRKNVGEALLHSKLAPPGTVIGLTLAPIGAEAKPIYARWKELAAELELPCRFDVGAPGALSFTENLAASDLILTTSVAEGFGMAYLESWLAGRALAGRDLPEITTDFKRAGIRLDGMEPRLHVPLEWIGHDEFCRAIVDAYQRTTDAYELPNTPDPADALSVKTEGDLIDFGDLDEPLQEGVLRRVCRNESDRRLLLECNPWIEEAFSRRGEEVSKLIRANVEAIGRHFSLVPSGRRLMATYDR
ncbi:MAG: hypothetical protein ABIP48_12290, partial [Planctomycetota bacterium]